MTAPASPRQVLLDLADRCGSRLQINGETGCHEWTGANVKGYGVIKIAGKNRRIHRYAWSLAYGAIPTGLHVCHRCDNRRCFNLDHLFLGTPLENERDKGAKSRQARGEQQGHAVLTEGIVRKILADTRMPAAIARELGLNRLTVASVKSRRNWRHIQ